MFETASAVKLSSASVTASLLLHSAGILLLCLVSFPGSPRLRARRVVLIAPSLENPARHSFKVAPKPRPQLVPPHRRFEAPPPRAPELLPKLALDLPPTPVLEPVRVPLPVAAPAPELPRFAPPPTPAVPKVTVKAAGFASTENAGANISARRLPAMGGFETTSGETATRRGGVAHASGFALESGPSVASPARPAAHAGGFGDASVTAAAPASAYRAAGPATISAEILDKPRASYSDEARRLNIEGEVLLEVVFEASGETKVLRVLRGLGHGLDESAIAAARQIHFRPAQRDGVAIDSSAVVHIIFQLAH
jgi:TonB family protein